MTTTWLVRLLHWGDEEKMDRVHDTVSVVRMRLESLVHLHNGGLSASLPLDGSRIKVLPRLDDLPVLRMKEDNELVVILLPIADLLAREIGLQHSEIVGDGEYGRVVESTL